MAVDFTFLQHLKMSRCSDNLELASAVLKRDCEREKNLRGICIRLIVVQNIRRDAKESKKSGFFSLLIKMTSQPLTTSCSRKVAADSSWLITAAIFPP